MNANELSHVLASGLQHVIREPIVLGPESSGRVFAGRGARLSTLIVRLPPGMRLFNLHGVRDARFSDFAVYCDTYYSLGVAVFCESTDGYIATNNVWQHVVIDGTNGGLIDGFVFGGEDSRDANNSEHCFDDVHVLNFVGGAWRFRNSQSKCHQFSRCQAVGWNRATSPVGVCTSHGRHGHGGSFHWQGGNMAHLGKCFEIGVNDPVSIEGLTAEHCDVLLATDGPTSAVSRVAIRSTRFDRGMIEQSQSPVIDWRHGGSLVIDSCDFKADRGAEPSIDVNTPSPASITLIGTNMKHVYQRGDGKPRVTIV